MNVKFDFLRCRLIYLLGGTPNSHLEALNVAPVIEPKPKFKSFTPTKKPRVRGVRDKTIKCPVLDKISMIEPVAKSRAAQARAAQYKVYMRAYKYEFCPCWHLTHHKSYL